MRCPVCRGTGEGRTVVDPDNPSNEANVVCPRCGGERTLAVDKRAVLRAVQRAAHEDHDYGSDPIEGHPFIDATYHEGLLAPEDVRVEAVRWFGRVYAGHPEDIGEVEVTYHERGYRALYGFTATAKLALYAD